MLMESVSENIQKLHALRDMGVHFAIDDFGTGYSSLSYLAKLPVDSLKIDRTFIMTMIAEPQSLTIVSTIISLAHALDLIVVAEGVETEDQLNMLRALGCDEIQGDIFSKPLPWKDCLARCDAAGPRP
jgi:EAL domain-containing protein (putative c-di-GMP-specific phosphodiesterase class I)